MNSDSACLDEYAIAMFSPSEDHPLTLLARDGSCASVLVAAMWSDHERATDVSVDERTSGASPARARSALVSESSCDSIDGTDAEADVDIAPTRRGAATSADSMSSSTLRSRRVRLMAGGGLPSGVGTKRSTYPGRYRFDTFPRKLDPW